MTAAPPVSFVIVDGPLPDRGPGLTLVASAGAVLTFEGRVRPEEDGRPLAALDYEAYPPMTEREATRLAKCVAEEYGLLGLAAEHSVGRVAAGACSFRVAVAAPHRAEALAGLGSFVDRLKREVPLWKTPVWPAAGGGGR